MDAAYWQFRCSASSRLNRAPCVRGSRCILGGGRASVSRSDPPRGKSRNGYFECGRSIFGSRAQGAAPVRRSVRQCRCSVLIFTPVVREGQIAELRWDYLNAAAAELFNLAAGVAIGSSTTCVRPVGWNEDLLFDDRLAPLAERGGREAFDVRVQGDNGEQWFHVAGVSLEGSDVAWVGDVSPRVHAEQALAEADCRKDESLATLAHELRNPLAPIHQVAAILEQPGLTDERRTWCIAVLRRQSAAMALLLDDLLDVSRITRGALALREEPFALKE